MIDAHFEELHKNIKLTKKQKEDVGTKVDGVSKSLFGEFYSGEYQKRTRFIIGSHGKKTETRFPVGDIDLIFKIPKADFERYQAYTSNGPAALLQRAKDKLRQTYSTTEKIVPWGKVVLIEFGDSQHNVEVLPCYENDDGTFTIPNSEGGGTWDIFDPRAEMRMVKESHKETGITRTMIKLIKRWKRENNISIKSFQIEYFCVSFAEEHYSSEMSWSQLLEEFFVWLELQSDDFDEGSLSKVTSAKIRAQKARDYELSDNYDNACLEWRKIFGNQFPKYDNSLNQVKQLEKAFMIKDEEYIEDTYTMGIDDRVSLSIEANYQEGAKSDYHPFSAYFRNGGSGFRKQSGFCFTAKSSLGSQANYFWKVRNFHDEAADADDLRGKIIPAGNKLTHYENAKYLGTHYIDCYAIKGGVVVARARRFVPIGKDSLQNE